LEPSIKYDGAFVTHTLDSIITILNKVYDYFGSENLNVTSIAGPYCDIESLSALKNFTTKHGSSNLFLQDVKLDHANCDFRSNYSFNLTLAELKEASFCLLIHTNPR